MCTLHFVMLQLKAYLLCSFQLLVLIYLELERRKGFITSGVLFIFWVIANVIYIVPFYTYLITEVGEGQNTSILFFSMVITFSQFNHNHSQQTNIFWKSNFTDFYTQPHNSDGLLWFHVDLPSIMSVHLSYVLSVHFLFLGDNLSKLHWIFAKRCMAWWLIWMQVQTMIKWLWFWPLVGEQHSYVEIDREIFSMVILSLLLIQCG